jgi:hypothetical protein
VYLRAQRDLDEEIGRDHTTRIAGDRVREMGHNERITVHANRFDLVHGKIETHVLKDAEFRTDGNRIDVVSGSYDRRVRDLNSRVEGRELREVSGAAEHLFLGDIVTRVTGNQTIIVGRHDARRALTLRTEGTTTISAEDGIVLESKALTLKCGTTFVRVGEDGIEGGQLEIMERAPDERVVRPRMAEKM